MKKRRIQSYRSKKFQKNSKRHPRLEALPGWRNGYHTLLENSFRAVTAGKGVMEAYETFPGIEVSFNVFLASEIKFQHDASDSVLEIYYCRSGRVGWNMQDGTASI